MTSGEEVEARILQQLLDIDKHMADNNSTAVTGTDGMQRIRTVGKCVDVNEREYFKAPMGGADYYINDLIISKSTGTAITTVSVPVYNHDKSAIIGICQRNIDTGVLHDMVAAEVTQDRQEIVVVDRTGTVVAHSVRTIDVENPEKQDQNPFYTDSRGDVNSGNYVSDFMGDTWMISWTKIPSCGWIVASCRVKEVALSNVYKTAIGQAVFGLIFIIAAIVVAVWFSRYITLPLGEVNSSLAELAEGRFAKIDKYTERRDEFGEIIRSTNNVIGKLDGIVSGIVRGATDIETSANQLASMSGQISQNTVDVSNAVQEIASGAATQSEEISHANISIENIGEAVEYVQASTASLRDIATRMQQSSHESVENLSELKNSSETMNSAINNISDKISATSYAVERINGMVEAITNIATQTNLLALNASIEAARAGDAGRGFAVVAEEIGKLASDSSESASQIRTEMDALLKESQEAVSMAGDVQDTNNKQQAVIDATYASVNTMIEDINKTVTGVDTISANAEACVSAKNIVVDAMTSLSSISEENTASSQETGAAMQELSATVTTLSSSAESLNGISDGLAKEMSFFARSTTD
ncbi:MAG: methyl-accepting chemotaxis protein [Lachnospiraceae bacterium]|nr:methyl-accepting chemotaxis protein [Lachnospiraceae bacterium]